MTMMMLAAMLMGAAPATPPQTSDPDMVCMIAMAVKAESFGDTSADRIPYDRSGGYFVAIVAQRYPTAARFAPAYSAALDTFTGSDHDRIAADCYARVEPALDLIRQALDLTGK